MSLHLDLQLACTAETLPSQTDFHAWAAAALGQEHEDAEVTIRIVDADESQALNRDYRGKDQPTNVLSFPFQAPPGVPLDLLGDLVICAPVVEQEAQAQQKAVSNHWAHMVIHGMLHLLGYDHIDEQDAEQMEALEIKILKGFNIPDPYQL